MRRPALRAAVLGHPLGGRTIAEMLGMSAADAEAFFAEGEARTPAAHTGVVYVLAEPTTGLHLADVEQLKGVLSCVTPRGGAHPPQRSA